MATLSSSEAIYLLPSDWQVSQLNSRYKTIISQHSAVNIRIEEHYFHDGFRLVRWRLNSRQLHWHNAFNSMDYIGFCFTFGANQPQSLALSHLCHQDMNITSGYSFDGGFNQPNWQRPLYYVSLQFSPEYLDKLSEETRLPEWLSHLRHHSGIIDTLKTPLAWREKAWQLCCLPCADNLSVRLQIEALALQWLAQTLNYVCPSEGCSNKMDDVIDIIRSEYHQDLSIHQLARRVGINSCYLKQQFKQKTGMTINQFITQERLLFARQLLCERADLSVKVIANRCGYRAAYFSEIFKKFYGQSPVDWRNNPKQKIV